MLPLKTTLSSLLNIHSRHSEVREAQSTKTKFIHFRSRRKMTTITFILCLLVTGFALIHSNPVPSRKQADFVNYLIKYGYLGQPDPRLGELRTDKELREAVRLFQRVTGLPENGDLSDEPTLLMTEKKRCGLSDFGPSDKMRRKRRYALQGTKWNKKDLTFKIVNYTPDLPQQETHDTIVEALNMWAKVVPLTFTETTDDNADIKIKFTSGYHGDGYPFDGKSGTLAHAFYPHNNKGLSGDAHFDEDETFTIRTNSGVNLLWVAVHEFGHSLGLSHSQTNDAIMYPFYRAYVPDMKLHTDDINGIQQLYGKPDVNPQTPTPNTQPPPTELPGVPQTCNSSVDVMVYAEDGLTYAFKGDYFWPISDQGKWTGALKISDYWPVLPGNLDAAFTRADKTTLFFKDSKYWEFKGRRFVRGPLEITGKELNLPKELENMDAALVWGANGRTYFFKGDKYWRYNDNTKSVDPNYPRSISNGWKVPNNLDAALQWKNGKSYLFKGLEYYGYDDSTDSVPAKYPLKISTYWMGCSPEGFINGKIAPLQSSAQTSLPSLLVITLIVAFAKLLLL